MEQSMLDAALDYARDGIAVFPCRANKAPANANGFHGAQTSEGEVRGLWHVHGQDALIGGVVPEGIIIIDVDPRNGGSASLAALQKEHGRFPATKRARTGSGGYHYWFALPSGWRDTPLKTVLADGIDVKQHNKGYVILPPSVSTAGEYRWFDNTDKVATAPQWMLEALERKVREQRDMPDVTPLPPYMPATDYGHVALKHIVERLLEARAGERNNALNSAAFQVGQLVAGEQLREGALAELEAAAALLGLTPDETEKTLRSGYDSGLDSPWVPDPVGHTETVDLEGAAVTPPAARNEPRSAQIDPESAFWTRWDVDEPAPPFYLDPLIPKNAYVLVYGATEAAKSMAWNAILAAGSHHGVKSSVYSLENPAHVDRNRLKRLGPDPSCFRITHEPLDLHDHLQVASLVRRESEWGTDIVLIDTYSHAFGLRTDDGNARAIAFAQVVRYVMNEVGCSVVVIDHTGYAQKEEPRDASAKRQQVDVAILMERVGTWRKGSDARFTMTNFKAARFANPFENVQGAIHDEEDGSLTLNWASEDFESRWKQ